MPQIDLGQVVGPQGAQGEPGPQGAQGIQGPAGPAATINGVNALTIEAGDNIELSQSGSTTTLSVPTDAAPTEDSTKPVQSGGVAASLANKAPAGFGLGGQSKELTSGDDLNTIWENGWYRWGSSSPQNAPKMTSDVGGARYIFARVANYDSQNVLQEYWSLNQGAQNKAHRICRNGVWGPLEWINPSMQIGVEYRTTERHNGKPVYKKAVNTGALSAGTSKSVAHGVENIGLRLSALYGINNDGDNLVGNPGITGILVGGSNITITTAAGFSTSNSWVVIAYTKTTD